MNINTANFQLAIGNFDAGRSTIRIGPEQNNFRVTIAHFFQPPNIIVAQRIWFVLRINDWPHYFGLNDTDLIQLSGLGFCAKGLWQIWRSSKGIINLALGSTLVLGPPAKSIYYSIEDYRRERIRARIEEAFDNQELSSAQKLQVLCDQFPDDSFLVQMINLLNEHQPLDETNCLNGLVLNQLPLNDARQILWDFRPFIENNVLGIDFKCQVQRGNAQSTVYFSYCQHNTIHEVSSHPSHDLNPRAFFALEADPGFLGGDFQNLMRSFEIPQLRTLLEGNEITGEGDIQVRLWQPPQAED